MSNIVSGALLCLVTITNLANASKPIIEEHITDPGNMTVKYEPVDEILSPDSYHKHLSNDLKAVRPEILSNLLCDIENYAVVTRTIAFCGTVLGSYNVGAAVREFAVKKRWMATSHSLNAFICFISANELYKVYEKQYRMFEVVEQGYKNSREQFHYSISENRMQIMLNDLQKTCSTE